MNKTRIFAGIALGILMTLSQAVSVLAAGSTLNGCLDSVEGNAIAGWAWDAATPGTSQTVSVTITNRSTKETAAVLTAEANEYREDLAQKGMGGGCFGFHVTVDWESLPEAAYQINLSVSGTAVAKPLYHSTGSGEHLIPLGVFKTTAYCPCYSCSEGWGRHTSSGKMAAANHTVAVDPRVIPIGSRLLIDGTEYVAEDIGGGVKGHHIDIFFNTHGETRAHGTRNSEVFLIQ